MLENTEGNTNGYVVKVLENIFPNEKQWLFIIFFIRRARREVKLKGLSTPRGSMQMGGVQTKESGQLTEVTCDKAALMKDE